MFDRTEKKGLTRREFTERILYVVKLMFSHAEFYQIIFLCNGFRIFTFFRFNYYFFYLDG